MRLFECGNCGQVLFFENTTCEGCGSQLGFLPELFTLSALAPDAQGGWRALLGPDQLRRLCTNAQMGACNWLVPEQGSELFCTACRLNRTIPNLEDAGNPERWRKLEVAKHRVIYSLLRLGLSLPSREDDPRRGLAFKFVSGSHDTAVTTGHAEGVITIDLAEADDPTREQRRENLAETYRTLLGHLRHEVGHYFWDRLVAHSSALEPFRALFGDERADYGADLKSYYANGPETGWPDRYISAYASAHAWEDWAETWAHYLHMLDTLETAFSFGLSLRPVVGGELGLTATIAADAYDQTDFSRLIENWLPITYAVNSLNRSMGQPDLYPFVLAPAVIQKLRFVHELIRNAGEEF